MQGSLRQLGLDPRHVLQLAKSKQMIVWNELYNATNKSPTLGDAVARVMEATANAAWPPRATPGCAADRAPRARLRSGVEEVPTTITPD